MNIKTTIEQLHDFGILSDLDIHFAKLIAELSDHADETLLLGAVLVSYFTSLGSSCVDLNMLADQSFPIQSEPGIDTLSCPTLSQWQDSLQNCHVVGHPGEYTPLIFDKPRLYLYRYWYYEQQLAVQIHLRSRIQRNDVNHDMLENSLSRLFPDQNKASRDYQKIAARTAVLHNLCIISGGPGTGKTFTVVKILALLLEQNINLNIALAAPTGKAAIRLQHAITQTLPHLNCASTIKAAIPQESYTIHRLLGSLPNSPYFRSHSGNLLPYDVVIIDEASMIDLALMAKLAQAISKSARWILLGDKDQLASVEAGTVLGDICEVGMLHSERKKTHDKLTNSNSQFSISNNIVLLDKSYRFKENSGIWTLAQAVKQGESENALRILKSENYPDVSWYQLELSERLSTTLLAEMVEIFSHCLFEPQPEKVLQAYEQFRILCATRRGLYGVEVVNRKIEEELSKKGLIRAGTPWYHGRPIIITRNDYTLKLFNGDVGIILKNPFSHQELQAFFPSFEGEIRTFWPNRLPEHETVYAMTIHKSQGSEFDNVLILLPEQISPLLTRELVYTGITRARQSVRMLGNEQVFKKMVSQKISRSSGLREQLVCSNLN